MNDLAIVVVAYGTTNEDQANQTILPLFASIKEAFPKHTVSLAYSSMKIVSKIRERGGQVTSLEDCWEGYQTKGFKKVLVEPLFVTEGEALLDLDKRLRAFGQTHASMTLHRGEPLIPAGREGNRAVLEALKDYVKPSLEERKNRHGLLLIGHGGTTVTHRIYENLQVALDAICPIPLRIGALTGTANVVSQEGLDNLVLWVENHWIDQVHIYPLFYTAGYHVNKDILGPGPDSICSQLGRRQVDTVPHLLGLGQSKSVAKIVINEISKKIKILLEQ